MTPTIAALFPRYAVAGGRVTIEGGPFLVGPQRSPVVRVGGVAARLSFASGTAVKVLVPESAPAGRQPVRLDDVPGETAFLEVAAPIVAGIHAVDNPVVLPDGTVFVTCSATRGQQTPVSVYRCTLEGRREIFVSGITNATSLAVDPDGRLHVTSRFDGTVSRIDARGRATVVASDLGVACGLAFAPDGTMFVGDRSGTIFRVGVGKDPEAYAALPPSMAAFHLAMAPDGETLFATGPTLAGTDVVYRIGAGARVSAFARGFGRPQGLAFDAKGRLHVVEALAGASGVYRLDEAGRAREVVTARNLVGLALDGRGGLVVAAPDALYHFETFD